MADSDIILYLHPHEGSGWMGAKRTISLPQNESRRMPVRHCDDPEAGDMLSRRDSESAEQPEGQKGIESNDCLVLRFSHGAKFRQGVVAGWGPKADLALPNLPGIGCYHLAFTFDDKNRPIVKDLGSSGGTRVIYDGEKGQRRSKLDYLLQGPPILGNKPSVLDIAGHIQFKVVVPPRNIASQDYMDRVAEFRKGTADPENLLANLDFQSVPGTQPPTGTRTPLGPSDPVFYEKKVGRGTFGEVIYVWNVTTGEDEAVKRPRKECVITKEIIDDWKSEAEIMRRITHKHIVTFRGATFSPRPQLRLEYAPGGSFENYNDISYSKIVRVLRQLLSALEYLHGQHPPIGHRDIKPANILVHQWNSSGIHVKFADFGIAKAAEDLKTCCGTRPWAAPELCDKFSDPAGNIDNYSVAVDIWSLGLVIASKKCEMPSYMPYKNNVKAWPRAVLRHVEDHKEKAKTLFSFLLTTMLVIDPKERKVATYCHHEALRLPDCESPESTEESDSGTPTPSKPGTQPSMGHEEANEVSTIRPSPQADDSQIPGETAAASTDQFLGADLGYHGTDTNNSTVNPAESGTSHGSGASTPHAQLHQGQVNSDVLPKGSVLGSKLCNPEPASSSSNHSVAAAEAGGPQNDAQPEEQGLSYLILHDLGNGARDNEAQETSGAPEVVAREPHQSGRKRTWLEEHSPLGSPHYSLTDSTAEVAGPQRDNVDGQDSSPSGVLRASKRRKIVAADVDQRSG